MFVATLAALYVLHRGGRALDRAIRRKRARRAVRGEARAERLARRLGYRVDARQLAGRHRVEIDGVPVQVQLRADLSLHGSGDRLIGEVKTGQGADPTFEATRRQLLEYAVAYRSPEILLFDMRTETVRRVRFPGLGVPRRRAFALAVLTFVLGWLAASQFPPATAKVELEALVRRVSRAVAPSRGPR